MQTSACGWDSCPDFSVSPSACCWFIRLGLAADCSADTHNGLRAEKAPRIDHAEARQKSCALQYLTDDSARAFSMIWHAGERSSISTNFCDILLTLSRYAASSSNVSMQDPSVPGETSSN